MLRVLIVDDTLLVASVLKLILEDAGDIEVVGIAENGRLGIEMAAELKPDIVTMDIHMPEVDGIQAIKEIMASNPRPIVVVSSSMKREEQFEGFEAIDAGAVAILGKPPSLDSPDFQRYCEDFVQNIRAMSEVRVVRRGKRGVPDKSPVAQKKLQKIHTNGEPRVVLLGASTGGPYALHVILEGLDKSFPLPIVVVQHITPGFLDNLVGWMDEKCTVKVKTAEHGEILSPGVVYFAPDEKQLELSPSNSDIQVHLSNADPVAGFRPSVNVLFHSAAKCCPDAVVAGLLTGMGSDGAEGLKALYDNKAYTFAQDEASCVVYGMPAVAVEKKAVKDVLPLTEISAVLATLVQK